jgi:hypothetical protein
MGPQAITAMFFFLTFFGMIFGIFYFRNRENMAMIERGINPRSTKIAPKPFVSLKYGLLLCGAGLGLFLAFLLNEYINNHGAAGRDLPQIYFSLIALFGGLGLVLSYRIEKKEWLDKKNDD